MQELSFLIISLLFIFYGIFSSKIHKTIITAPMIFVLSGLLLGSDALGVLNINVESKVVRIVAELSLVIVLFSDASRFHLKRLLKDHNIPVRLLSIGLPLTIIFGSFLGFVCFKNLKIVEVILIGLILSPTDAALGHSIISNKGIPVRIRQSLNMESGLNDGLVLPIFIIFLSFADIAYDSLNFDKWILLIFTNLFVGAIVGLTTGFFGGKIYELAHKKGWVTPVFGKIITIALAILSYSLSILLLGNGFIAAFITGLTIGNTSRSICKPIHDFAAIEGQFLTLLLFFLFGLAVAGPIIMSITYMHVIYAILSLTIIRMIPVFISLIGCKLKWETIVYLGWFGPRGLASIVFSLMILEENDLPHQGDIFAIATTTILFSIFLHGISSYPGSRWYEKITKTKGKTKKLEEDKKVTPIPIRYHHNR
jgi:NhaP-type Na+/H+ or K+/H+ antiporter